MAEVAALRARTAGPSTRWARECGVTNAKQMLLTGREIDGDEAFRIGFASAVFDSEDLEAGAVDVGEGLKCPGFISHGCMY